MSLFFDKPIISGREFKLVRAALADHGFSIAERDKVEEIFRGDLQENNDQAGIDAAELARGLAWLRDHKSKHHFSDRQIDLIETELRKYL